MRDDPSKSSLGAVVWPGQTSAVPRGWKISAIANKLRVGVPVKNRVDELVKVHINGETDGVYATGFCIDVFEQVMRTMSYPVQNIEYIPYRILDQNSTGYYYDGLVDELFLEVNVVQLLFCIVNLFVF